MRGVFLATVLSLALVSFFGCGSGETFTFTDGDGAADEDGDMDSPDSDLPPLDGDEDPMTEQEREVEQEMEAADGDALDGDIDIVDGDHDLSPDGDEEVPPGTLVLRLTNVGSDAAYVTDNAGSWDGHLGFTLLNAEGQELHLYRGCTIDCSEPCVPIMCEEMPEEVRQILPGSAIEFNWAGEGVEFSTCQSEEYGEVNCNNPSLAPAGNYRLRFCYSTLLDVSPDNLPSRRGDVLSPARTGETQCQEYPIELTAEGTLYTDTFAATLGQDEKPWAYCGQAWTFTPDWHVEFSYAGAFREGSSVVLDIQTLAGGTPYPCWRYGGVFGDVQPDSRQITIWGGMFYGQRSCDMWQEEQFVYPVQLPPLPPGEWTANILTMGDWAPSPLTFTVNACPECSECLEGTLAPYGEHCVADCSCADDWAFCSPGRFCQANCLTSLDCGEDLVCGFSMFTEAVQYACSPQSEPECMWDMDCKKGFTCQGSPVTRCMPDLDTRVLAENHGLGIHCGCDAECPGKQSCVRYEFNFTEGFCALTCHDERECPPGWRCLDMTESGLQAICTPP
ncbi:MAG: hypothetical protein C4523_07230 [Myxococcales bacterium]|nr:MAG: hypothetical protein C4523_07230 [Myxococcales bacterium]